MSRLVILLACGVLLSGAWQTSSRLAERRVRGAAWLQQHVEQQLGAVAEATPSVLLAVAALIRTSGGGQLPAVAAIRERLLAGQRPDGSFGTKPEATWRAVAVLLEATDTPSRAARAHALEALEALDRDSQGTDRRKDGQHTPPNEEEALRFLAAGRPTTVSAERVDPAWVELFAFAGGPLDVRATYQRLGHDDHPALTGAIDGSPDLGPLHEIHLVALVLDGYRSPRLADRQGRTIRWPERLLDAIDSHWNEQAGAWGQRPGGPPDLASTASALLALDVLDPWLPRLDAESPSEGDAYRNAELHSDCAQCHQQLNPSLHVQWERSEHAQFGVDCVACHGKNHSLIFREQGRVPVSVCGRCHEDAVEEFSRSRHARAMDTLHESRLFAQTPDALQTSCRGCHQIGRLDPGGPSGSCNSCHPGHEFSADVAREPEACTVCHTGADYPQDEAYRLSKHGALYATGRDPIVAPTCASCHHPGGTHDDGFGLTLGSSGVGAILQGGTAPIPMPSISAEAFAASRADMLRVCTECHSSRLAEASLRDADRIKQDGELVLAEAAALLRELHAEGLVVGDTDGELRLGGQQTRVDPALPGAGLLNRFYEMWRYRYNASWKGAYHSSFSVANQGSLSGLHEELLTLRAEAARLRAGAVR